MPDTAQPTPTHDLASLRGQINKLNDRILMRLHDRAGFPRNPAVYQRGAITLEHHPDMSLLEFALEGLENYHASLGRYEYPEQIPLVIERPSRTGASRVVNTPSVPQAHIDVLKGLIGYYVDTLVPSLCAGGEDEASYGETAYVDADLLELLNERINVGRRVALAKQATDPSLRGLIGDAAALRERLLDAPREEQVLAEVAERARRYEIDGDLARSLFRWIMDQVLELEVVYLQRLTAP